MLGPHFTSIPTKCFCTCCQFVQFLRNHVTLCSVILFISTTGVKTFSLIGVLKQSSAELGTRKIKQPFLWFVSKGRFTPSSGWVYPETAVARILEMLRSWAPLSFFIDSVIKVQYCFPYSAPGFTVYLTTFWVTSQLKTCHKKTSKLCVEKIRQMFTEDQHHSLLQLLMITWRVFSKHAELFR